MNSHQNLTFRNVWLRYNTKFLTTTHSYCLCPWDICLDWSLKEIENKNTSSIIDMPFHIFGEAVDIMAEVQIRKTDFCFPFD